MITDICVLFQKQEKEGQWPFMAKVLKYDQVKLKILSAIAEDALQVGDRLPSERDMMRRFSISQTSFRHAIAELEWEGLLERRPRSGSFLRVPLQNFQHREHVLMLELLQKDKPFDPSGCHLFPYQWKFEQQGFGFRTKAAYIPGADVVEAAQSAAALLVTEDLTAGWIRFLKMFRPKPLLVIGDYPCNRDFPAIKIDHREMARAMVREFAAAGCRRIGFINAIRSYLPSRKMHEGYVAALRECGLEYRPEWELTPERDRERDMVADFMERHGAGLDAVMAERYIYYAILASKWNGACPGTPSLGFIDVSPERIRDYSFVRGSRIATYAETITDTVVRKLTALIRSDGKDTSDVIIRPLIQTV